MSAPPEAAGFLSALKETGAPAPRPDASRSAPATARPASTNEDVRARVVDLQQSVDRILADTTPAAIGTSGTVGATESANGSVSVDRARLMQLRQQIDGLLATLNRR
jgi:hypothetical protein